MTTTSLCNFFSSYRPQITSKCGEENIQQSFQHSDLSNGPAKKQAEKQ